MHEYYVQISEWDATAQSSQEYSNAFKYPESHSLDRLAFASSWLVHLGSEGFKSAIGAKVIWYSE